MALSMQVLYPVDGATRFDFDYYLNAHMPLVAQHMGAHIRRTLVTRGVGGGAPGAPAAYYAIATMIFDNEDAMKAALAAAAPVIEDIPNFTDSPAEMLAGEVAAEG